MKWEINIKCSQFHYRLREHNLHQALLLLNHRLKVKRRKNQVQEVNQQIPDSSAEAEIKRK